MPDPGDSLATTKRGELTKQLWIDITNDTVEAIRARFHAIPGVNEIDAITRLRKGACESITTSAHEHIGTLTDVRAESNCLGAC